MNPSELQAYLYEHIPLTKAMQVEVVRIEPDSVVLGAPLEPNINHRDTVFGGSASALAILSAWALLYTRLLDERVESRLVIQRQTMSYERPIAGEFTASSSLAQAGDWSRFAVTLRRRGRARIRVAAVLTSAGRIAGRMEGDFVALK